MKTTIVGYKQRQENLTAFADVFMAEPRNSGDLTGPKLGLAAVMFLYVALACSLPLIFLHCVQYRSRRRAPQKSTESGDHTARSHSGWATCFILAPDKLTTCIGRSNCLAAGALLSVGFLDVFMDAMENMEEALKALHVHSSFPISSFTMLLGFLLIVGVEQITLDYYHHPSHQVTSVDEARNEYHGVTLRRTSSTRVSIRERALSLTGVSEAITVAPETMDSIEEADNQKGISGRGAHAGHSHLNTAAEVVTGSWIRIMMLLFAISLHSVFEGMALGLCETLTSLLTLFAALSLHKLIIAVSIGINLATETTLSGPSSRGSRKLLIYQLLAVLTFAGASPLGALIGWAVTDRTESVEFLLSQAILQGLACGTFCYVVFCELLPKELQEEKGDKPGKFFFLVLGFCLVAFVIAFLPGEE
ncbi:Zinc transporter ZIP3 [Fasciola hepatica]|uniref:Zinc transporter ZIP3 n=1 Tax=Fasciola hepatica TaxID=6192 RepID=A0A2H1CXK8_FASHE|nr:Zinc transporter ZIP3 [Fasciola hepatica]